MKSSDITQGVLVVLLFVGLMFANTASAGVERIKKNWPEYRCNPSVMPFAASFGHDPVDNFTSCIAQMQTASMGVLTAPFTSAMSMLGGAGGGLSGMLSGGLQSNRGMFSNLRGNITGVVQNIFGVFLNIVIQVQKLFLDLKDLFSKIVAVLATMLYFVRMSFKALSSVWNGPPGELLKGLCFSPDTLVPLMDGSTQRMCDIRPGQTLRDGGRVTAVLDIDNTDASGNQVEAMYTVPGGEGDSRIRVSGSHLVYHTSKDGFVPVRDLEAESGARMDHSPCPKLSCLVTSDHIIPIGEWRFHDWEDSERRGRVMVPRIFSI